MSFNKTLTFFALLLLSFSKISYANAPKVVVTIKPIYALVASIMSGVGKPTLLLPDGASPHTFQLKPSTLKQLQQADLIIWVGPQFELFMIKPMQEYRPPLGLITLLDIPTLQLLPLRQGREWEHHHEGHDHDHAEHASGVDPHYWLSTQNAEATVVYLAAHLAKVDPKNAKQYLANAKKLNLSIRALKQSIARELAGVHQQPFLVYHDGYQYFEKEFDLNALGTMILNPNLPLSANGLNTISQLVKSNDIKCVFRETEFNDNTIVQSLGKLNVKVAELDPLGARIPLGPNNYQEILQGLANTLKQCLDQTPSQADTKSNPPNH